MILDVYDYAKTCLWIKVNTIYHMWQHNVKVCTRHYIAHDLDEEKDSVHDTKEPIKSYVSSVWRSFLRALGCLLTLL